MRAASADVVKVGLIASYTGAFATWGTQFQQAVEAYQASVSALLLSAPDTVQAGVPFLLASMSPLATTVPGRSPYGVQGLRARNA